MAFDRPGVGKTEEHLPYMARGLGLKIQWHFLHRALRHKSQQSDENTPAEILDEFGAGAEFLPLPVCRALAH